jgi:hypothetical protein
VEARQLGILAFGLRRRANAPHSSLTLFSFSFHQQQNPSSCTTEAAVLNGGRGKRVWSSLWPCCWTLLTLTRLIAPQQQKQQAEITAAPKNERRSEESSHPSSVQLQ